MKYAPLVFLAAFFALSASWSGLIMAPQIQIGREQPTNSVPNTPIYPAGRPGLARQGADVYRANGCYYCHSQQVTQTGAEIGVTMTEVGTNPVAAVEALLKVNPAGPRISPPALAGQMPKTVLENASPAEARAAMTALRAAGAVVRMEVNPLGPDIARGWGIRRTIARDFLFDHPVMPGSLRAGPDLASVGLRLGDAKWHLRHLYNPRIDVKNSSMPRYPFLFEKRKIDGSPSPNALDLPPEFAPPDGYEIVPTPDALALVEYLLSLRGDAPVWEAPMTVITTEPATNGAPASTNAPAQ